MNTTEQLNTTPSGLSSNADRVYNVSRKDLPLHCPLPSMSLWNSHPRVYLAIEESGRANCPYCGTQYILEDHPSHAS